MGTVAVGQAELGGFPKPRFDKTHEKVKRQLVQDEIRAEVEENRCTKMVGMYKQGAWTRWEHAESCKITWSELCYAFNFTSNQFMTFSPARPTYIAGEWQTLQRANCARGGAPWSTSSVVI